MRQSTIYAMSVDACQTNRVLLLDFQVLFTWKTLFKTHASPQDDTECTENQKIRVFQWFRGEPCLLWLLRNFSSGLQIVLKNLKIKPCWCDIKCFHPMEKQSLSKVVETKFNCLGNIHVTICFLGSRIPLLHTICTEQNCH